MKERQGDGGPRFESAAEIDRRVDAYFDGCRGAPLRDEESGKVLLDRKNKPVLDGESPPTLAGLALALGFSTREALKRYRGEPRFEEAVRRGMTRVEQYAEEKLYDKECSAGAKFILQNDFESWRGGEKPEEAAEGGVGIMEEIRRRMAKGSEP